VLLQEIVNSYDNIEKRILINLHVTVTNLEKKKDLPLVQWNLLVGRLVYKREKREDISNIIWD